MEKQLKLRWARLALGVVSLLFAGIIYAWSIIRTPFLGFGWDGAALTLNFTLTMCFFCIGGLISGLLAKRLSVRIRLLISALLVFGGFFIVSRLTGDSIFMLYLGYGIMTGTGIGIVYNVVIATTNAWFPDRKGISSGALMMGFGFSTLLLGNLAVRLFDTDGIGWRTTYVLLGGAIGVVLLICAFIMKAPPAGLVFPSGKAARKQGASPAQDFTAPQMLGRLSFWKLFVFFILFAAVGSTAIAGAQGQFAALGAGEAAVTLAGILTVCNGLGRIASGAFFDAFGLRKTQYLTSFVVIAATALTLVGYACGINILGMAGLLLCGFSYGFSPTVSAAFASAFYGQKNFALNFPILNLILIPASFIPTLAAGWTNTVTFAVLVGFSVVGLLINISIKKA